MTAAPSLSSSSPNLKSRILSQSTFVVAVLAMLAAAAAAQVKTAGAAPVTIDPDNRTVTTTNFVVAWSTADDTEAITNITWLGGSNLTNSQGIGTCWPSFPGSVEYFGNSYAPPDPWAGGLVLVGGGTTTPAGTTAWSGQLLSSGTAQVTINSSSTGCPPSSAGINVQTTYSFSNPNDPGTNSFGVQRAFDFTNTTFAHDFRPYMARLSLFEGFTEVLYPATNGALATVNVNDCGLGCTGPIVVPNAATLKPLWDSTQGWFAMHNPTTLQGVVVKRNPSTDPQGNSIVAQLWVDNDGGSNTNVSSFLLMSPTGGFTGGMVTEVETLCFYDGSIWTPSLTPPAPCNGTSNQSPTSTKLVSSLNPSTYSQSVTFTASVSSTSGTPTGSVVFTDTSTSTTLGSATLISGTASLPVSSLAAGTHSIAATYQGSTTFASSTSAPLTQVVDGIATTTVLASSLNPSVYGQSATFTATVSSSSGTPTGTVNFYNGSVMIGSGALSGGKISISISSLTAGSNSITATYQGSSAFTASTSTPVIQVVSAASTSTSLASSLNPAGTGQSITFTAAVTSQYGGAVTGSVTFSSGSLTLGTASLSGNIATLNTSFTNGGTYSITAHYNGDSNNVASTSTPLSQKILASTATTLVSSLNPSIAGQSITFTATVTSNSGTPLNGETVTFSNGSAVLGTGALSGGVASFSTSSLSAGIYSITASYAGDASFAASTSKVLRQVVNSTTKSATATSLASSLNPSIYGQKVTWTAIVTTSGAVPPTGKVNFVWSGYNIGTATLNASGVATLTRSNLNADTYPLTAIYTGDANNLRSTSGVVSQVITEATSAATLTSSQNPSSSGQLVTFTATITSPTFTPTGPVTFTAGKTVLGTAELSGGKAQLAISTLAVGSTTVKATYAGDSNVAESSATIKQTVQ